MNIEKEEKIIGKEFYLSKHYWAGRMNKLKNGLNYDIAEEIVKSIKHYNLNNIEVKESIEVNPISKKDLEYIKDTLEFIINEGNCRRNVVETFCNTVNNSISIIEKALEANPPGDTKEFDLKRIAQEDPDDNKANKAMKELKKNFDSSYKWCEDCDGMVCTEKECCLNQNNNIEINDTIDVKPFTSNIVTNKVVDAALYVLKAQIDYSETDLIKEDIKEQIKSFLDIVYSSVQDKSLEPLMSPKEFVDKRNKSMPSWLQMMSNLIKEDEVFMVMEEYADYCNKMTITDTNGNVIRVKDGE